MDVPLAAGANSMSVNESASAGIGMEKSGFFRTAAPAPHWDPHKASTQQGGPREQEKSMGYKRRTLEQASLIHEQSHSKHNYHSLSESAACT